MFCTFSRILTGVVLMLAVAAEAQVVNPSGGSGSGTVNSGTAGQLATYATSGTAVSGTNALPSGTTATCGQTGSAVACASDVTAAVSTISIPPFNSYVAHGDSNTLGTYISNFQASYPLQLGNMIAIPAGAVFNKGVGGATAYSLESLIYSTPISSSSNSLASYMIGTNVVTAGGASATYLQAFSYEYASQLAWMAIPSANKILGTAMTCSGTCTAGSYAPSKKSTATATTITFTTPTAGTSVFLSTSMYSSNAATASLSCDGTATGVTPITLSPAASYPSAASALVEVTGLANTTHTCVVTQSGSGNVDVNWAAAVGTIGNTYPQVYAPSLIDRYPTDANTPTYRAQESTSVAALRTAGLTNLNYFSTAGLIPSSDYVDTLHGEDYEGWLIAETFVSAINTAQSFKPQGAYDFSRVSYEKRSACRPVCVGIRMAFSK